MDNKLLAAIVSKSLDASRKEFKTDRRQLIMLIVIAAPVHGKLKELRLPSKSCVSGNLENNTRLCRFVDTPKRPP